MKLSATNLHFLDFLVHIHAAAANGYYLSLAADSLPLNLSSRLGTDNIPRNPN